MRHRDEPADETPGGDSFLDIVANIVGILVLLVVVVGVRAGRHVLAPAPTAAEPEAKSTDAIEAEISRIAGDINREQSEVLELRESIAAATVDRAAREAMREQGVLYVKTLRAELDAARADLSETDQRSLEVHNALAQTHRRLEELDAERIALMAADTPDDVETLVVSPTPIVTGEVDETVSFRLKDGRLVYVPMQEIEDDLRSKMRPPTITDPTRPVVSKHRVGPFRGFAGRADVVWRVRSSGGRIGLQATLGKLVLEEITPLGGESVDAAFGPAGSVNEALAGVDPESQVVRLLVYEDSFDVAPDVKKRFEDSGFRVAQSFKRTGDLLTFSSDGYSAITQ